MHVIHILFYRQDIVYIICTLYGGVYPGSLKSSVIQTWNGKTAWYILKANIALPCIMNDNFCILFL